MRDVFEQIKGQSRWEALYEGFRAYERFLGVWFDAVPDGAVCVGHAGAPEILKAGEHVVFHFERVAVRGDFFEGDVVVAIHTEPYAEEEPACRFVLQKPEPCYSREWAYGLQAVVRGENVSRMHEVRQDGDFLRFLAAHGERRAAEIFRHLWRLKPSFVVFDDVNHEVVGQIYG